MNDRNGRNYKVGDRSFIGNSRATKMANNNLGIVLGGGTNFKYRKFRSQCLDRIEKYVDNTQYDHLAPWRPVDPREEYVAVRSRKPSVIFPFAKIYMQRLASKLVGASTFPKFDIVDDKDASYFLGLVRRASFFDPKMVDIAKNFIAYTSCFARFHIVGGAPKIEVYNSNYCYPEFDAAGELEHVEVKYIYETDEMDQSTGKMICRWYKLELSKTSDTLYDNPVFDENSSSEPEFQVVDTAEHNLGFVQGEWFRYGESTYDVDGAETPVLHDLTGFIDAINYNLSQSDSATSYGLDPQLVINGLSEEEVDELIKSSSKAWLLGRQENKAQFLEVTGSGVATAKETEERLMKKAADAARIVFLDPEKTVASAQSGKAMEVLHAPMVEVINEIRPWFEKGMIGLLQKITATLVLLNQGGAELDLMMPKAWEPMSLDITCAWPPIFPLTIQDMQQIVAIGLQAANGNLIARDTAAKWIQTQGVDFGVEDWDAEVAKINGQKQFGGFF
jgi:hypothetical protein